MKAQKGISPFVALLGVLQAWWAPAKAQQPQGGFASSCSGLTYWGSCRLVANCTLDGSDTILTSYLDLGRCLSYNANSGQLEWTPKTIPHWQTKYCEPCNQCTIDQATAVLTCQCQFTDASKDHTTQVKLNDHLYNKNGVLGCFDALADTTKA